MCRVYVQLESEGHYMAGTSPTPLFFILSGSLDFDNFNLRLPVYASAISTFYAPCTLMTVTIEMLRSNINASMMRLDIIIKYHSH